MFRLGYVALWLIVFIVPVLVVYILPNRFKQFVYQSFYKIICRIFRIKIHVTGKIAKDHPILFASNHVSYLDILILGASLPSSFISKASVGSWPIVGFIAKLTGTILIERKKSQAGNHLSALKDSIKKKKNLTLFPEGTTGDGISVLNFKSSLFKIAEDHNITIQPVTIKYTKINGLPVHRNEASELAWIGDMDLQPHLKNLLKMGTVEAEVIIHEALPKIDNRKEIASKSQEIVAAGLAG